MEFVYGVIVGGIVVGIITGLIMKSRKSGPATQSSAGYNNEDEKKKAENLAELKGLVSSTSERITNDWVQKELGVSDATAERYLNELEKDGVIKQIGDSGSGVYYEKN